MLACRYVLCGYWYNTFTVQIVLSEFRVHCLLVDLGQELVVAEQRVLVLADLDGAAAVLSFY